MRDSTTTRNGTADAPGDGPALVHTGDIADYFKHADQGAYAKARRAFYREVNLDPRRRHPRKILDLIEWSFQDWLALDCSIVSTYDNRRLPLGFGYEFDRGERKERIRGEQRRRYGADGGFRGDDVAGEDGFPGITPYILLAELMHEQGHPGFSEESIRDAREMDGSNFTSLFWIRDANAAKGRVKVEDALNGGEYDLVCAPMAAKFDGASAGLVANRIAWVREAWRPCAIPLHEARHADEREHGKDMVRALREHTHRLDFPGLVRLFYGRPKEGERHGALRDGIMSFDW